MKRNAGIWILLAIGCGLALLFATCGAQPSNDDSYAAPVPRSPDANDAGAYQEKDQFDDVPDSVSQAEPRGRKLFSRLRGWFQRFRDKIRSRREHER
jgi:hypothetical protein